MLTKIGKVVALPGIFAVIYLTWVFGTRWIENRRYKRQEQCRMPEYGASGVAWP
jgi:hypothetical protein